MNYQPIVIKTVKDITSSRHYAHAQAQGADLIGAILTSANLTGAHLEGANLTGANLTGANLTGANLTDADLTDVKANNKDILGRAFEDIININIQDALFNIQDMANFEEFLENLNNAEVFFDLDEPNAKEQMERDYIVSHFPSEYVLTDWKYGPFLRYIRNGVKQHFINVVPRDEPDVPVEPISPAKLYVILRTLTGLIYDKTYIPTDFDPETIMREIVSRKRNIEESVEIREQEVHGIHGSRTRIQRRIQQRRERQRREEAEIQQRQPLQPTRDIHSVAGNIFNNPHFRKVIKFEEEPRKPVVDFEKIFNRMITEVKTNPYFTIEHTQTDATKKTKKDYTLAVLEHLKDGNHYSKPQGDDEGIMINKVFELAQKISDNEDLNREFFGEYIYEFSKSAMNDTCFLITEFRDVQNRRSCGRGVTERFYTVLPTVMMLFMYKPEIPESVKSIVCMNDAKPEMLNGKAYGFSKEWFYGFKTKDGEWKEGKKEEWKKMCNEGRRENLRKFLIDKFNKEDCYHILKDTYDAIIEHVIGQMSYLLDNDESVLGGKRKKSRKSKTKRKKVSRKSTNKKKSRKSRKSKK